VHGLNYIEEAKGGGLKIGALATISSVLRAPIVRQGYPILAQAAASIAATQIQNRGTIVGNICNAVPSADSAPALLCLNALLHCMSSEKERTVCALCQPLRYVPLLHWTSWPAHQRVYFA